MRSGTYSPREVLAAAAVLLCLASLAAFSLWGMTPSSSRKAAAPTVTTTPVAPTGEREDGGD